MASFLETNAVLLAAFIGGIFLLTCVLWSHKERAYPPGPPRWPIIGNAFQVPSIQTWLTFSKWARKYGQLVRQHPS